MNNYYRNKRLRESAKHESCVSCGADDGTVVWCHSNEGKHGKGMGIKAHDLFGFYGCLKCHQTFDSGWWGDTAEEAKEKKSKWFRKQWEKSMIRACEKGYL